MRAAAAPLLAAVLLLGACATEHTGQGNPNPTTPTERYSIDVQRAPEEVKLAPHGEGLSPAQAAALGDFVSRWVESNGGDITLKAPEHNGDRDGAYRTVVEAKDYLIAQGVAPRRVRIVGYDAGDDSHAPIVVGYMRYHAEGPRCGQAWGNLSAVSDNREYDEFGCAMTANLAAQIADPGDLVSPRPIDPPDAQRRQQVLDNYRKGAPTSTQKDSQADGTFSKAGQ